MIRPLTTDTAESTYATAKSLHAQGRLRDAEEIYRALLGTMPSHLGLLQRLAEVCYRTDRLAEAVTLQRRAVAVAPDDARVVSNLAMMLHQQGASCEALPLLEHALVISPGDAQTLTNLGVIEAALGHQQLALSRFSEAAALAPHLAAPRNNAGNVLMSLRRYDEAVAAFQDALARDGSFADAWNNLGNALFHLRRAKEAIPCFERALSLNPRFAQAQYNWGTVLGSLGVHDEAVLHYRAARRMNPQHVATCNNLGRSLNALGQPDAAIMAFQDALALDLNNAAAHAGIGSAHLYFGRTAEALAACEKAVALAPTDPAVHRALSEVKKYRPGDPEIGALEQLAQHVEELTEAQQAELHFALFKAYADCGDPGRAFASLTKANAAKRRQIDYDEAANLAEMRRTAEIYSRDLVSSHAAGDMSSAPIFIFGMPRSGTTLVEQIIASHPRVFGAGEAAEFGRVVVGTYRAGYGMQDPSALRTVDLGELGARYVAAMQARLPRGRDRFTDKMPANFRFAGLIHMVLPRARLIHIARDPLDCCFSCFSKLFNGSLDYTYDLGELGRYYRSYDELMVHWRAVLPEDVMLEVRYEDLVGDIDVGARRLIEHCGLDWDPRCLEFHKTERPVITASTAQVRRPVYKTAIGRSKPYEAWLGPLREALEGRV